MELVLRIPEEQVGAVLRALLATQAATSPPAASPAPLPERVAYVCGAFEGGIVTDLWAVSGSDEGAVELCREAGGGFVIPLPIGARRTEGVAFQDLRKVEP